MTDVRNQRSEITRRDAECTKRFFCSVCASVFKADRRSPTFDLWFMRFAQSLRRSRLRESIGLVTCVDRPPDNYLEAFQRGLRDHGYVGKKSVVVEYRTS